MDYVAFEVGRGGPRSERSAAADRCRHWNRLLDEARVGLRLHPGFRATGNYIIVSGEPFPVANVTHALQRRLRRRFVVFSATDFLDWFAALKRALSKCNAPKVTPTRRPTPGAVIDLNPGGDVAPFLPAPDSPRDPEAWTSSDFAIRRVRGVWKNDLLSADGKTLDPGKREGTWGALAQAMTRTHGGDWTARALSTLEGLSRRLSARGLRPARTTPASTGPAAPGRPHASEVLRGDTAPGPAVDAQRLHARLRDPALIRLYRQLVDDDVALAEEGLAEYQRRMKAADGA